MGHCRGLRLWTGAAVACMLGLSAPAPWASSTGIVGFSGNPATSNGNYCNICHYGGPGPQVAISGPTQVQPGSSHTYVLRIAEGGETAGGLNVSVSEGSLTAIDSGTKLVNGEITHVSPRLIDPSGNVVFRFKWTAPLSAGSVTLYGAANSVDLNGQPSGDRSTKVSRTITVK